MTRPTALIVAIACVTLAGCASPYDDSYWRGYKTGYMDAERQAADDVALARACYKLGFASGGLWATSTTRTGTAMDAAQSSWVADSTEHLR